MPAYAVFHAHDLFGAYRRTLTEPRSPVKREQYHKVADVQAKDLEEVFCLTNTIDSPWWTNPAVTQVPSAVPTRSTSVGDLIAEGAQLFLVDHSGFTPVWWEDAHTFRPSLLSLIRSLARLPQHMPGNTTTKR